MNSQLLPVADLSLVQLRLDERLADAARKRALRNLQPTGPFTVLRGMTSNTLVRIGQRLKPAPATNPENDEERELLLIPLAR
jgi:hypothetical protein